MKKLGVIIFVILLLAVGGLWYLWYLGAPKTFPSKQNFVAVKTNLNQPAIRVRPTEDTNNNGTNDWTEKFYGGEKNVSLVLQALEKKQGPLIPMEVLPVPTNKTYQLSDLQLTNQTDELSFTNYGTEIMQIMSDYRSPSLGNELTMILDVTNGGKTTQDIQSEITKSADRYKMSAGKLLALAVPRSAGQIHLNLINNLTRLSENARLMAQVNDEPIIALSAAQLQTNRLRQMLANINNVNLFFSGHNLGLENKKTIIAIDL